MTKKDEVMTKKDFVTDQEFINDMPADSLEDYNDGFDEEYLRELRRNRYPKGM